MTKKTSLLSAFVVLAAMIPPTRMMAQQSDADWMDNCQNDRGDWGRRESIYCEIRTTTAPSQETTLHTTLDPKTVDYSGYRIRIVGLSPYPKSGSSISADKYVVTLNVSTP